MPSKFQITKTVNIIKQGGVIAYATEGVFGLGCDPDNAEAIKRILDIKQRKPEQGLILIASSMDQLTPYLGELSSIEETAMDMYWPGPTTLVMNAHSDVSPLLTGGRPSIAVRITAHPDVRALCDALGHALVSTSANRSGCAPAKNRWQLNSQFSDELDYIYPSTLGGRESPSDIFDVSNGQFIRAVK
jgi:L-threonylcarbamoyladenylate synthase